MSDIEERTLPQRIESLESEIEEQRHRLRFLEHLLENDSTARISSGKTVDDADVTIRTRVPEEAGHQGGAADQRAPDKRRGSGLSESLYEGLPDGLLGLRSWEWWLNKVGVGLLLFGVAFLFKFSVDQGWLTPGVRVGIGLSIGLALVLIGLRVYEERRVFGQGLLGGGIGAFYMTSYAAFQLYDLVSYPAAIAFMVAVTSLAFTLALRQNGMALALIGGAGGFSTPFVLYTNSGSLGGLVIYTASVLFGVCAVYLYKGWRALLILSSIAVWMIFLAGYDTYINFVEPGEVQGRTALLLGVAFAWLMLWGVSTMRELLRQREPARWGFPEPDSITQKLFASDDYIFRSGALAHLLSIASPLLALAFFGEILGLQKELLGWVALGGAGVYALVSVVLKRIESDGRLSYTHALVALLLSTLTVTLVLEGDALFFALAVEATLLHLVSRRLSDRILSTAAHVLFLIAGVWLLGRLVFGTFDNAYLPEAAVFFDFGTWVDLTAVVLAFVVFGFLATARTRRMYGIAGHAALLGWLWRELAVLPESDAYVSLAWGVYAVALLIVGLRLDLAGVTRLGLVTLFAVVGKLFLVDLAWVGAVWRILLFLGFGGLLLLLSYYLQSLWRPGDSTATMKDDAYPRYPGGSGLR